MRLILLLVLLGMPQVASAQGKTVCIDFESPLVSGTQWSNQQAGTTILSISGIDVKIQPFHKDSSSTFIGTAFIDDKPIILHPGQVIGGGVVNLLFDFRGANFTANEVRFTFTDTFSGGGRINFAVNGDGPRIGKLQSYPDLGGARVDVGTIEIRGGSISVVRIAGKIDTLEVGGEEFAIDDVCVLE
ncbi:hypothetical protein [Sinorhizobium meliloti]|uniref:hypothetical protein n=1 Tax=Rhizobium meliloti TaxID=382 RepID=UPI000FD216BA|nr:hypothetical protein [Sinorhizobium meliloti]RVM09358.1 hypothetical protein CN125_14090 [Sinorhizobium meliloti]RVM49996.1 hypothetical protein CN121_07460 [Sinorhizobium meliloti]RVM66779.1 hypothetical protein CN124_13375 [Sinorhizobium meliloti]RVM72990.1 hypothetical protein CN123_02915 [Sinorhizobium meliloti]RVM87616.1 hypothetical protein CN117_05155 [Sinorhizobium meliloti]